MRFLLSLSAPKPSRVSEIQSRREIRSGLSRGHEGHGRSFIKAVSWRTVGTIDTFIISFFVTGKASLAGGIAAVEVVTKIMIYYLHERLWAVVPWGHR
jgi:uncharacterized membrane protein